MVKRNGIKDFIDRLGLTEEECRNLDNYYTEYGPFLTIEDMEGVITMNTELTIC